MLETQEEDVDDCQTQETPQERKEKEGDWTDLITNHGDKTWSRQDSRSR